VLDDSFNLPQGETTFLRGRGLEPNILFLGETWWIGENEQKS